MFRRLVMYHNRCLMPEGGFSKIILGQFLIQIVRFSADKSTSTCWNKGRKNNRHTIR